MAITSRRTFSLTAITPVRQRQSQRSVQIWRRVSQVPTLWTWAQTTGMRARRAAAAAGTLLRYMWL
ncbi:MAG: hypothetical protein BWZ08_02433 [candidate division BRC1 bacterium ADurb.BinA292]|nr:MAG: hypothetical protein BWZ08_02433 [candidate division BRC1 bacterium ADurb.BinA292]